MRSLSAVLIGICLAGVPAGAVAEQAALSDDQVAAAIALGRQGTDLSVHVGTVGVRGTACSVIMDGPMARIAAAAGAGFRAYRPFGADKVTADMRATTYRVRLVRDFGDRCLAAHVVLQPVGAPGLDGVIQPIAERAFGEAVFDRLPAGDFQVVVVADGDAHRVRVSAKDRMRLEFAGGLSMPSPIAGAAPPAVPPAPRPPATGTARPPAAVTAPTSAARELRLVVSGDAKHAADAITALRAALQATGQRVTMVPASAPYDYRIVFAEGERHAGAAIALDADGHLAAVVVRDAFTDKGAAEAAARDLARKLAALVQ